MPEPKTAPSMSPDEPPGMPPTDPGSAGWRAVVDGDVRRRAIETAFEVAAAIEEDPPEESALPPTGNLGRGDAGFALLHYYLFSAFGHAESRSHAERKVELAGRGLASEGMAPGLYAGFTGIAWVLAHLQRCGFEPAMEFDLAEVDDALCSFVAAPSSHFPFDLITGLVGMGVYGLERLPGDGGRRCVERVVEALEERADESDGNAVAWFTPPALLHPKAREIYPEGKYDLGVAHGVPGVVGFLAAAARAGVGGSRTERMLRSSVRWLLEQQTDNADGVYPYSVVRGQPPSTTSRLAWCYGDPGLAAVLTMAGAALDSRRVADEAIRIAEVASERSPEESGVKDAGLCHGAAGLAHIFARIYGACGRAALLDSSRYWLKRALSMRSDGEGVAGFRFFSRKGGEDGWIAHPGFLEGACGVALALLAAATDVPPDWDRVLLLSG